MVVEILFNFVRAREHDNKKVELFKVFKRYLLGYFIIDLSSLIPLIIYHKYLVLLQLGKFR